MPDKLRTHIGEVALAPSHVIREVERIDALVIHGRNEMLGYGASAWPYIAPVVMTGTLVFLGAVSEAVDVLCETDSGYCEIRKAHSKSFKAWKDLRHDVSLHIDRIFRERPSRSPRGFFDKVEIAIASIRPHNEIRIQTGGLVPVWMNAVLTEMQSILEEVRAVAPSLDQRGRISNANGNTDRPKYPHIVNCDQPA